MDHLVVLLLEVVSHRDGGACLALLELAGLGTHVKADTGYLVRLMVAIASHHNCSFEFIHNGLLEFALFGWLVSVTSPPLSESLHLFVNEFIAVIDREILGDVVDDEIETSLEDPGGCEEAWPGLHCVVKHFGF